MPDETSPQGRFCPSVAEFAESHGLELLRFAYLLCGNRYLAENTAAITLANGVAVLGTSTLPALHC